MPTQSLSRDTREVLAAERPDLDPDDADTDAVIEYLLDVVEQTDRLPYRFLDEDGISEIETETDTSTYTRVYRFHVDGIPFIATMQSDHPRGPTEWSIQVRTDAHA